MVTRNTKRRTKRTPARRPPGAAKQPRAQKNGPGPIPKRRKGEPLHEYLLRLGNWVPEDELAGLPKDVATNWHHYAHGGPKQDP